MTIQPRLTLRAGAALWGLAIAISTAPLFVRPAPPGQLPGLATALGFDARAPFRFIVILVVTPFLITWLMTPIHRLLLRDDTRRWARNSAVIAMSGSLWFAIVEQNLLWVIAAPLLVIAICVVARTRDADFNRRDATLLPTLFTVFFALIDIVPSGMNKLFTVAAIIVFGLRIAIRSADAFALSPLGLALQSQFFARDQRHSGWAPLTIAVVTPIVLRMTGVRMRKATAWIIFPVAAYAYSSAISVTAADGKPRSDLFEGAHSFLSGAEMIRGEKPYRDIIPTHGLISDALLGYWTLKTGAPTIGRLMRVRGVVENLNHPAEYFLAYALTGSPEVGIVSYFFAQALGSAGGSLRLLPALLTLAILAAAVRLQRPKYFIAAGLGVVFSALTSVDFSVYIAIAAIIAGFLSNQRRRALLYLLASTFAAGIVSALLMAMDGILIDFFRTTVVELPRLTPAYSLGIFTIPQGLKTFHFVPEVLLALFDKTSVNYVAWVVVLVTLAATAFVSSGTPRRRAAFNALRVVGVFVVICAISYAERHHLYFQYAIAPLFCAVAFRFRRYAPIFALIAAMMAQPTIHLAIVAALRNARGPTDPGLREVNLPRARGAYFNEADAAIVNAAQHYASSHFGPRDTFFDFTNHGLLFFLMDRDCPIRQVEVAFYEPESEQREVIRRIEQNTAVRAAIVPLSPERDAVDGVANAVRAPLVWAYLQQRFEPDVTDGGVAFWRRRS